MKYWFGFNCSEVRQNLVEIVSIGWDSSMVALWNDQGHLKYVAMGSGSGSTLMCVLAENTIDFRRLTAIGYTELCWNEHYDMIPSKTLYDEEVKYEINEPYRKWFQETFDVIIPSKASELIGKVALMDDKESDDSFFN